MPNPLVSVIVPTRNSAQYLQACLESIKAQTFKNIEIIVVDRDSSDLTKVIALRYTEHVYNFGPERSSQRNFGFRQSHGRYVAFIDSDMELSPKVIESCMQATKANPPTAGVIIPEESIGEGFWAKCKRLERSFYVGVSGIEAARFSPRGIYLEAGGYDEALISGEDWDLSNRMAQLGPIAHATEFIRHNEGRLSLVQTLKNKYYYARRAKAYLNKNHTKSLLGSQSGPVYRFKLFLSKPSALLRDPVVGVSILFMKTMEYFVGALGLLSAELGHAATKWKAQAKK